VTIGEGRVSSGQQVSSARRGGQRCQESGRGKNRKAGCWEVIRVSGYQAVGLGMNRRMELNRILEIVRSRVDRLIQDLHAQGDRCEDALADHFLFRA